MTGTILFLFSLLQRNILNHHPYGTFYYSKKNGRCGKRMPRYSPSPDGGALVVARKQQRRSSPRTPPRQHLHLHDLQQQQQQQQRPLLPTSFSSPSVGAPSSSVLPMLPPPPAPAVTPVATLAPGDLAGTIQPILVAQHPVHQPQQPVVVPVMVPPSRVDSQKSMEELSLSQVSGKKSFCSLEIFLAISATFPIVLILRPATPAWAA